MGKQVRLFPFQENAVSKLIKEFKKLWVSENNAISLVFKSPTGSGKTIMMAQFLRDLARDPQFDVDKCFVWVSFGGDDSYRQSYNKLFHFYDSYAAGEITLLDVGDLSQKKMRKNSVFFINWGKIKASKKEGRILRAASEYTMKDIDGGIFDEFIINTRKERKIVLIVDEAHLERNTELADEIIDLINPKIQMHVSATPKKVSSIEDILLKTVGFVSVVHDDVVKAGLIKEQIISQSEEDILAYDKKGDINDILLELAIKKRKEIKQHYENIQITNINPLVLIQIPNQTKNNQILDERITQTYIQGYLNNKGIKNYEIAIWLSEKKENLEEIVKNNSQISFLIFKQAAATGWDCPRAQVLVMYREIRNPTFHIQTVGRILRMPEAKHYPISDLNKGYLYTNYKKNQIHEKEGELGSNTLADQKSTRRKDITLITIPSIYLQRQDYNDLKPSPKFQSHLAQQFDQYFGTKENIEIFYKQKELFDINIEKVKQKRWRFNTKKLDNDIIVNAHIENYDDLFKQIQEAEEIGISISGYETEQMYKKICYDLILKQENEHAKYAPERSWSVLKSALNVWVMSRLEKNRGKAYNAIVHDLLSHDSVLKKIIEKVLVSFRPITDEFLGKQSERKKQESNLEIPLNIDWFTNDYEKIAVNKSAVVPFYQSKSASSIEKEFIQYLEEQTNIDWWYKNGDKGQKYFSIPYDNNKHLFYPDWIIRHKNGSIWILDTKKGYAAKEGAKERIEALHKFIKDKKIKDCQAGIVVKHSGIWKVNTNETYKYDDNCSEFTHLTI